MVQLKLAAFALLAFNAFQTLANQAEAIIENEEIPDDDTGTNPPGSPKLGLLKVQAQAAFPDTDVFGVKLVNGEVATAYMIVLNQEEVPVTVRIVGGSFYELDGPSDILSMGSSVRNLSSITLDRVLGPGENTTFPYQFMNNMHPQDLRLILAAIVQDTQGQQYQVNAFNGTVSIVDAPISYLDPQVLFLYLILASIFVGTGYFVYNTWVKTLFPQQKKRIPRKPVPAPPTSGESATTSGAARTYDESWIPAQHLQRPEAKRIRSGASKTKTK